MAFRLSDVPVRVRLYVLLIISTLSVAAILALAGYLLMTYRVGGPVYADLQKYDEIKSELTPPVMYEVYITLQEMETLTRESDIRESKDRFERLFGQYEKSRAT